MIVSEEDEHVIYPVRMMRFPLQTYMDVAVKNAMSEACAEDLTSPDVFAFDCDRLFSHWS